MIVNRKLTQAEMDLILNYKYATDMLNALHTKRNNINISAWERAAADQAYYQTMTWCDDLIWQLGLCGLDAETLLEYYNSLSGGNA